MDKITIVFWSQGGNTAAMAAAVAEGVKAAGKEAEIVPVSEASLDELKACMEPSRYVGRAPKQVDEFLTEVVNPILESNKEDLGMTAEINV